MRVAELQFTVEWLAAGGDERVLRETSAQFGIRVGEAWLTRSEDIWSRTVRDTVLVSTYPVALWLAANWWRLGWEPLPKRGALPGIGWRMAHEIGAADSGFVWPRVVFASDGEAMNIWAVPSAAHGQSVRYLCGLDGPQRVPIESFRQEAGNFIESVRSRLDAIGCSNAGLAGLWRLVRDDMADPAASRARRLEAQMGFDPDECPEGVLEQALTLQSQVGDATMAELAPVYGRSDEGVALSGVAALAQVEGLCGRPQVEAGLPGDRAPAAVPWERGMNAARRVREHIGNAAAPLENATLYGLLGLDREQVDRWVPAARHPAAVATRVGETRFNFVPRKRHPVARRFEFARFLADFIHMPPGSAEWLASTDLATARQKFQRAFAAEFLCPVDALVSFLGGDFSEPAIEDAAQHFEVSEETVEWVLKNNGHLAIVYDEQPVPYRIAA